MTQSEIKFPPTYMEIKMSSGFVVKVDVEDYEWLSRRKWHVRHGPPGGTNYAVTNFRIITPGETKRVYRKVYMHRLINNTPEGMHTDHKNGDGLDNRRFNLRNCTQSENFMNQHRTCGTSKYKGVYWHKKDKKWISQIQGFGKYKYLGTFTDEKEAALAYNNAAIVAFGEFAHLNKIGRKK